MNCPTTMEFVVLALAAWRVAHLLVAEDGPWAAFSRLRWAVGLRVVVSQGNDGRPQASKVALNGIAGAFDCTWCMSVWTAIGIVGVWCAVRGAGPVVRGAWCVVVLMLAVSAGAILVQEAVERLRR